MAYGILTHEPSYHLKLHFICIAVSFDLAQCSADKQPQPIAVSVSQLKSYKGKTNGRSMIFICFQYNT